MVGTGYSRSSSPSARTHQRESSRWVSRRRQQEMTSETCSENANADSVISSITYSVQTAPVPIPPAGRFACLHQQSTCKGGGVTHVSRLAILHLLNLASSLTLNPKILGSNLSAFTALAAVLTLPTVLGPSLLPTPARFTSAILLLPTG